MTSTLIKESYQHIAARESRYNIPYVIACKPAPDREIDKNVWHAYRASRLASRRRNRRSRARRLQILTQNITGKLFLSPLYAIVC